jgi:hypothetical protein
MAITREQKMNLDERNKEESRILNNLRDKLNYLEREYEFELETLGIQCTIKLNANINYQIKWQNKQRVEPIKQ